MPKKTSTELWPAQVLAKAEEFVAESAEALKVACAINDLRDAGSLAADLDSDYLRLPHMNHAQFQVKPCTE